MMVLGDPAIIDLVQERARIHNVVAHLEIGARLSTDCNVAVDCNDGLDRSARPSEEGFSRGPPAAGECSIHGNPRDGRAARARPESDIPPTIF
jgi:hypothetical protein